MAPVSALMTIQDFMDSHPVELARGCGRDRRLVKRMMLRVAMTTLLRVGRVL